MFVIEAFLNWLMPNRVYKFCITLKSGKVIRTKCVSEKDDVQGITQALKVIEACMLDQKLAGKVQIGMDFVAAQEIAHYTLHVGRKF